MIERATDWRITVERLLRAALAEVPDKPSNVPVVLPALVDQVRAALDDQADS